MVFDGVCVVPDVQLVEGRFGQPVKPNCDVSPSATAEDAKSKTRTRARMVVKTACFLNMFQFTSVLIAIVSQIVTKS